MRHTQPYGVVMDTKYHIVFNYLADYLDYSRCRIIIKDIRTGVIFCTFFSLWWWTITMGFKVIERGNHTIVVARSSNTFGYFNYKTHQRYALRAVENLTQKFNGRIMSVEETRGVETQLKVRIE